MKRINYASSVLFSLVWYDSILSVWRMLSRMKVTASYSVLHTAPLSVDLFISNAQSRADRIKQKLREATEYSVLHLGTADLVAILRGIPNWPGFNGSFHGHARIHPFLSLLYGVTSTEYDTCYIPKQVLYRRGILRTE